MEDIAYVNLYYDDKTFVNLHLNWLSPAKVRRMIIGGSQKMIVYDDMENSEKIKIYDKGITIKTVDAVNRAKVDYRIGDMVAPKLDNREALSSEAEHFIECVKHRRDPIVNGGEGLRVVRILEAAQASITNGGKRIKI
jgi:predicted dehydrogenase